MQIQIAPSIVMIHQIVSLQNIIPFGENVGQKVKTLVNRIVNY
jgi:hypothetical protein